jgi:two-component system OmpR family response regulator
MLQSAEPKTKAMTKVLVVEDEGEIGLLLNIVLSDKNIDLDYVNSIETAKEYLKNLTPSIILLDNRLPDGYGVDFIPYIKSNHPDIHIMMVSGYTSAQDIALANGADLFIEKPFTAERIKTAFDSISSQC